MLNTHLFEVGFKYGTYMDFLDTANLKRKKKWDWLKSLIWIWKTCRPRGCAVLSNPPALPPKPEKKIETGSKILYLVHFQHNWGQFPPKPKKRRQNWVQNILSRSLSTQLGRQKDLQTWNFSPSAMAMLPLALLFSYASSSRLYPCE